MTTKLAITLVVLFAVTCHGFLARGRAKELAIMLQGGDTDFPNPGAGKNVQSNSLGWICLCYPASLQAEFTLVTLASS